MKSSRCMVFIGLLARLMGRRDGTTKPKQWRATAMKRVWLITVFVLSLTWLAPGGAGAQDQPIELRLSHWVGIGHNHHTHVLAPWAKMVEERSQGRLKVTIYPGGTLGKPADHWDMIKDGIADIGWGAHSYTPGRFPLTSAGELPFIFKTSKGGSRALWELYLKDLQKEHEGVKVLWLFHTAPFQVHTTRKPVKTLEDLGAMKIRSGGGQPAAIVKQLGAIPVTIAAPESYNALERRVVDGAVFPWEAIFGFKLYEVIKYHTVLNLNVATFFVTMNLKKYESLPPDLKKVIDDLSGVWGAEFAGAAWDKGEEDGMAAAKQAGATIYTLPPAELQRWIQKAKPVEDEWIASMEAKGLPGRQVLADLRELVAEFDP
jgi:TRAP-type transport system periplasmic protein